MISLIIKKEILQELRSKESLISMIIFSLVIVLLLSFTINPTNPNLSYLTSGFFWLTCLLSTVIGLLRSFNQEKEMNAFGMLLSSPIDRGNIYIGKMIATLIFIFITQLIIIPFFILLLNFVLPDDIISFFIFIIITDWAIAAIGVSVTGIGMHTRMGEVLTPILLYPLLSPVLISAIQIMDEMLKGNNYINYSIWLMIIINFSIIFSIVGYLTFETITDE